MQSGQCSSARRFGKEDQTPPPWPTPDRRALQRAPRRARGAADRFTLEGADGRVIIVAAGDAAQASEVARELADLGIRLIELCGGISPVWRPKVAAAVGPKLRVSSVTFGIESLQPAAVYNSAFSEGKPPREALVILKRDADPGRDRFVKVSPPQETTFVPVPDEATGARVAAELAHSGYGLIELYGGVLDRGSRSKHRSRGWAGSRWSGQFRSGCIRKLNRVSHAHSASGDLGFET
ncbi:DUF6506 family protein [Chelativorans sp.]|uniref:DUF6506 family protein n=1 Tax=Chelativorans sp. TaxID=2203393 RepID=UPI0035C678A3